MAEVDEDTESVKMTVTKLCLASDYYGNISPALARVHVNEMDRLKRQCKKVTFSSGSAGDMTKEALTACTQCGQVFRPGNNSVRLIPRMKLTKNLKKLQGKAQRLGSLKKGGFQQHVLNQYREGFNVIKITCGACGLVSRTKAYSRAERGVHTNPPVPSPEPVKLTKSQKKKLKSKRKQKDSGDGGLLQELERDLKKSRGATTSRNLKDGNRLDSSFGSRHIVTAATANQSGGSFQTGGVIPSTAAGTSMPRGVTPAINTRVTGTPQTAKREWLKKPILAAASSDRDKKRKKDLSTLQDMLSEAQKDKNKSGTQLANFLGSL